MTRNDEDARLAVLSRDANPAVPAHATGVARDVVMAEYQSLKAEQLARIGTRDNLLYATLAVIGGVLAAALTARQAACLLLVAPACVILGHTYMSNDAKISAIREYIRTVLAPQLDALTSGTCGGPLPFGWEFAHLADPQYAARRSGHLVVDLLAFAASPAAAITVCLAAYDGSALTAAAVFLTALGEAAGTAWLARRIIRGYQHPVGLPAPSASPGKS